jgi:hypothetical protein
MMSMARSPKSRAAVVAAGRLTDPAQDRSHPGGQLGRGEGLHHVVVGPQLEPEHAVGLPAPGGDQDHGDVARAADGGQDVEAVLGGEHDVEDDEVGGTPRQRRRGLGPGGGLLHLVALGLEETDQQATDLGVVVDHEQSSAVLPVLRGTPESSFLLSLYGPLVSSL